MQPLSRQKAFGRLRSALMAHAAFTGVLISAVAVPFDPVAATPQDGFANPGVSDPGAPTFSAGNVTSVGSWGGSGAEPQLNVRLNQPRTIIDWQTFNIGGGQTVNFTFNNRSDIVLNRVSQTTATIAGNLSGCVVACPNYGGNIWLYARSGIFFNSGAVVNTGGLLATTAPLAIADTTFLADSPNQTFDFGASVNASVIIRAGATINSTGGTLAFVAPIVRTEAGATVTAPAGSSTVLYGSAQAYSIQFQRDAANPNDDLDLVTFELPSGPGGGLSNAPVVLDGATQAGNVQVISKTSVMDALISAEGTIVANSAAGVGGDVILSADKPITVGAVTAGRDVTISTGGDPGSFESSSILVDGPISAGRDLSITTGGAVMTVLGTCDCGFTPPVAADVFLDSSILVDADISAGRNISLNAGGPVVQVGDGGADIDAVELQTDSSITLPSGIQATAGGTVTFTTGGATIAVSDTQQHTADNFYSAQSFIDIGGDIVATGSITLNTRGAAIDIGNIRSDTSNPLPLFTDIFADSWIDVTGAVTSNAGSVTATTGGASVSIGNVTSLGNLTRTLYASVTTDSSITVAGSVAGNGGNAGDGVFLETTDAEFSFGTRNTPGTSDVSADLFIDVPVGASVQAAGDAVLDTGAVTASGTFDSLARNLAITVGGTVDAGLSIFFDALSSITVFDGGRVTAGTDVLFDPDTIVVGGNVSAVGDLSLIAAVSIDVESTGVVDAGQNGLLSLRACACVTPSFINVSGNVRAGTGGSFGDLTLNTVNAGTGNITLGGNLTAAGATTPQYLTLLTQGAITQSGTGVITADILTGYSLDGATLLGNANRIDVLGAFRSASDFSLVNAQTLDVQGMDHSFSIGNVTQTLGFTGVRAGAGGVSGSLDITTMGAGSNLALSGPAGDLIATGATSAQNVTVNSVGSIVQAGGRSIAARDAVIINAQTLIDLGGNVVAGTSTSLSSGSLIHTGPSGNISAGTAVNFQTLASSVTVDGAVTAGAATTFNAGTSLAVNGTVVGGTSTIFTAGTTIGVAGTVSAGDDVLFSTPASISIPGTVTANDILTFNADSITIGGTASAVHDANLTAITSLNVLSGGTVDAGTNANATAGSSLAVAGRVLAGTGGATGNIALTATGAGGIALTGSLTAAAAPGPQIVILRSAGAITQSTGSVITTDILTGSSAGATALSGANRVGVLGVFRAGTDFGFANAQAIDVQGTDVASLGFTGLTVGAGGVSGDLTLVTTGANNNIVLDTNVTVASTSGTRVLTLISGGGITQAAGTVITADVLTGSSVGGTTLTNANRIGVLNAFRAGTNFTLTNAQALDVRGADVKSLGFTGITSGAGGVSGNLGLATTAGDLTLGTATSNLNATGGPGAVTLTSAAGFTQTGGAISGTAVTLTAPGNIVIGGAGVTAQNASFTSTGGSFTQAGGTIAAPTLTVASGSTIAQTGGAISGNAVTLIAPGNIVIAGAGVTAQSASFTSTGGSFTQTGGTIAAPTLTVASGSTIAQTGGTISGNTVTFTAPGNIVFGAGAGGIAAQTASLSSTGGSFIQNGGTIAAPALAITAGTDILIGDAAFTTAVAGLAASDINGAQSRPPIPATGTGQPYISTASLTLQAPGKIVQQNTGTATSPDGVRVAGATPLIQIVGQPAVVDLFGTLTDGAIVVPAVSVAQSDRVVVTGTNANWRINGCTIRVPTSCSVINFPITQFGDDVQNFQSVKLDPPRFSEVPLLLGDNPDALGSDPTLIGSGNDEITRGP